MSVGIIIKIAALGIVVALLNQILKHAGRDDQAFFVTMAGIVIVLTCIAAIFYGVISVNAGVIWIMR